METNNSFSTNFSPHIILENCPILRHNTLIASVTGIGNPNQESCLRINKYDVQSYENQIKVLAHVKTSVNFTSLAWTKLGENSEEHKYGFIVGGHQDGTISLWDVTSILNNKDNIQKVNFGLANTKKLHGSAVNSIKFNQRPHLFSSGSREIILASINLDRNEKFLKAELDCPAQDNGVISSLSWNEAVPYILAAGSTVGNVYIWDMKKNSLHMSICDPNLSNDDELRINANIFTYVMWMSDGFNFLMSYDHPDYQFMIQYDVRQSSAPSGDFHGGHSKSIIGIAKNPHDDKYVISLGKDNVVTCWNFETNKPITQLHEKNNSLQASQIIWLSKIPDTFLSAGLDGNIYSHQLNFTQCDFIQHNITGESTRDLPPKWFTKKSGVSFGFGGKLITFSEKTASNVSLHKLNKNLELTNKMKSFIEKAEKEDLNELLSEKINTVSDKSVNLMWVALKCYYNNDYNALFTALGYDKETLKQETYNYIGKKVNKATTAKTRDFSTLQAQKKEALQQGKDDALSFFSEMTSKAEQQKETPVAIVNKGSNSQTINNTEKPNLITETISKNINWNQGSEKLIKQSLLTGDLESAVEVALKCGREAEALLIAVSSGNQELLNKTKTEYFSKNKDLFVRNIFSSIINKNFEALLDYNVIKEWKEYILYAKTYLNDMKFASFAYSIAEKLSNTEEIYSAIVCFILGQNFSKCLELLYNKYLRESENVSSKAEKNFLLHNLFEEVIALKYILDSPQNTNENFDTIMTEYSNLLIENNLFVEACRYINKIRNKTQKMVSVYDRIYGHCESTIGKLFPKLQPPYNIITVKPKLPQPAPQKNVNNQKQIINQPKSGGLWDSNETNAFASKQKAYPMGGQNPSNIPGKMAPPMNANNMVNAMNPNPGTTVGASSGNMGMNQTKNPTPSNRPFSRPNVAKAHEDSSQNANHGQDPVGSLSNQGSVGHMSNILGNQIGGSVMNPNVNQTPNVNRVVNRPVNPPIAKAPVLPKQPVMPLQHIQSNFEEDHGNRYGNFNSVSTSNVQSGMMGSSKATPPPMNSVVGNPPRPNIPSRNPPMPNVSVPSVANMGGMKVQSPYNPLPGTQKVASQSTTTPILTETEEFVLNAFERYREVYASLNQDENKQKDFNTKIQALHNKLRNHEVKQNLLNILMEFINAYDNNAVLSDLKKLSTKIQSNGWDQNKTWMPCIDKIISIPRK